MVSRPPDEATRRSGVNSDPFENLTPATLQCAVTCISFVNTKVLLFYFAIFNREENSDSANTYPSVEQHLAALTVCAIRIFKTKLVR